MLGPTSPARSVATITPDPVPDDDRCMRRLIAGTLFFFLNCLRLSLGDHFDVFPAAAIIH